MTTKPSRYSRPKKSDRLLYPDANAAEIQCSYGVAPFDRVATEMEAKWGIDRLPELVTPELAAKYGKAMAHLNDCIAKQLPAECTAAAANCIKGLHAMDAEATANGAAKATGQVFEYELHTGEGQPFKFGVLADEREWMTAKDNRPDLVLFSMREVALALHKYMTAPLAVELADHFPDSKITAIKPKRAPVDYANGGDPLPF